jgi:hypothetical protein
MGYAALYDGFCLDVRCEASVRLKHVVWMGLIVLVAACKRAPDGAADNASTEPGGENSAAVAPAVPGRMNFHIDAFHLQQQPVEEFPGHIDGGNWTFLDCTTVPGDAHFVVGLAPDTVPGTDAASTTRGRVVVRTADRAAGNAFLGAFAQGFHTTVPETLTPKPLHPIIFGMSIQGTSLSRAANGNGFVRGGGSWTACEWKPATPRLDAAVFFNFNLDSREGEFIEKDWGQRDDLLALWARVLRDGPRGQRTPQEDANVAPAGPQLGALIKFAGAEGRDPFFVPGGKWLIYTAEGPNHTDQVCAIECANPKDHRRRLAEFQQVVFQVQSNDPAGQRLLVEAKTPDLPDSVTTADPSRFWWIDAFNGTQKLIDGPWNPRNVDCDPQALSPDSRYLALSESRTRSDGTGGYTQLFVIDLASSKAATLNVDQQWLEPIGWRGQGENLRLLVRTGLKVPSAEPRQVCLVNPVTGDWELADPKAVALPPEGALISPNGQKTARVLDHARVEVRAGNDVRSMTFHPEDRRFVDDHCVAWVNDNYLSFYNPYPILIDARSMKMNYALNGDWVPNNVHYSSDFKFAVLEFSDALVLAPVTGVDNP